MADVYKSSVAPVDSLEEALKLFYGVEISKSLSNPTLRYLVEQGAISSEDAFLLDGEVDKNLKLVDVDGDPINDTQWHYSNPKDRLLPVVYPGENTPEEEDEGIPLHELTYEEQEALRENEEEDEAIPLPELTDEALQENEEEDEGIPLSELTYEELEVLRENEEEDLLVPFWPKNCTETRLKPIRSRTG